MRHRSFKVALLTLNAIGVSNAEIVVSDVFSLQGGGFGTTTNFLTLQNNNTESGCIGLAPGGTFVSGNCATTGGTISGSDVKNPTNTNFNNLIPYNGGVFTFGFNATEPGNQTTVTFTDLILTLYSATGSPLYSTSGMACGAGVPDCHDNGTSITLTTQTGIGNYGFVFSLDTTQQAQLSSAFQAGSLLGVGGTVSNVFGGPDTFVALGQTNPNQVPEPMSFALMGIGLVGIGAFRQMRKA